jgi:hypothetical protein
MFSTPLAMVLAVATLVILGLLANRPRPARSNEYGGVHVF